MSTSPALIILALIASILVIGLLFGIIVVVISKGLSIVFRAVGFVLGRVFGFVFGEIGDAARLLGTVVVSAIFVPLTVINIVIGRWSAASHFGRAIQSECRTAGLCLYRMAIGHPARLLCLTGLTEGIENRVPEVVHAAPGRDTPPKRVGQFEGYTIVGSLPGGGSGGKLYIADADPIKRAVFERCGFVDPGRVVIKAFSLKDGSSLPQIVRESRALDAAKKLGLVLDHELTDERFFYVMPYVPGDSLGIVTQRLHGQAGADGLRGGGLGEAMRYVRDLLSTLDTYHRAGLWHKDVKPDNIIVHDGRAHLVDFGLLTPLRSSMTLTTHGTEYFRDPEMVRLALKGVKVHEVDGAKFDLYAVGAVLFSIIENSFPAHGGLSQVTKPCPEAIRWIIRRAMADYDKRYPSAQAVLADLSVVLNAVDPFAIRPADLPSTREGYVPPVPAADPPPLPPFAAAPRRNAVPDAVAGSPVPPGPTPGARAKPRIRLVDWWSGRIEVDPGRVGGSPRPAPPAPAAGPRSAVVGVGLGNIRVGGAPAGRPRRPAHEQLASARGRAEALRDRASRRQAQRRERATEGPAGINAGMVGAVLIFIAVGGLAGWSFIAAERLHRAADQAIVRSASEFAFADPIDPVPATDESAVFLVPGDTEAWSSRGIPFADTKVLKQSIQGFEDSTRRVIDEIKRALTQAGQASAEDFDNAVSAAMSVVKTASPTPSPTAPSLSDEIRRTPVLVLRESFNSSPAHAGSADRTIAALQAAGVQLVGIGRSSDRSITEREAALVASLRQALGLIPAGSDDARQVIARWLEADLARPGAVLWIARNPNDQDRSLTWFVPAKRCPASLRAALPAIVRGDR
ncbi:MAG: hypothetical protein JNM07_01980 [Phycisphaerae bacterium]|nr:hypothetical protein [Phycisphaerae bacterium]